MKFGKYPINYNSPGGRGERYSISFLNASGAIINLQYYNFLHLKPKYRAFYNEVIDRIKEYFKPFAANKYNGVIRGEAVEIGRLRINRSEISVIGTGLSFTWEDLSVRQYERNFLLFKLSAPEFKFIIDFDQWNSEVTFQLIGALLKSEIENKRRLQTSSPTKMNFNFVAADQFNSDSLDDVKKFVNSYPDFQTVTLKDEDELNLLLGLMGISEVVGQELKNSEFAKHWDLSKYKLPEFDDAQFDMFYEMWIQRSNREGNMDEYGNLIFLQGLSSKWNTLGYRGIVMDLF